MNGIVFYPAGRTPALAYAAAQLRALGCAVAEHPGDSVTHLLLPVPSFDREGNLPGGTELGDILGALPDSVTVIGGNLNHPLLEGLPTVDLLRDPCYLAQNAAITADCAIQVARNLLPAVLERCPALILGWGRIGKCLARQLRAAGAEVTVAARKEADIALLQALGYRTEWIGTLGRSPMPYRLVFNTVPAPVLSQEQASHYAADCIKIELASKPGIAGTDVVDARGLPGRNAPESAGLLMAETVMRLAKERRL